MKTKFTKKFYIKNRNSDLLVSEAQRFCDMCGLLESEEFVVQKFASINSLILDASCGVGRVVIGLERLGYKNVYGTDYSSSQLAKAKQKSYKNNFFKNNFFNCLRFRKKFDLIIYPLNNFMLFPGKNLRKSELLKISKMLKKGGTIILNGWNREKMGHLKQFFIEERKIWNEGKQYYKLLDFGDIVRPNIFTEYLHVPTEEDMQELFTSCGFEFIEVLSRYDITSDENLKREDLSNNFYYVARK